MNKPVLVVMAAGMGSRFGGLKQLEPIDDNGHVILDYSVYDATGPASRPSSSSLSRSTRSSSGRRSATA